MTETALATALNVSYMAEKISVFGIVVGVALILTGIGLVILAFAVFGRNRNARYRPHRPAGASKSRATATVRVGRP